MNHHVDGDGNLSDPSGRNVGKVDHSNRVYDGWREKGHIDDDGRYHDEYGRDQGWVTRDSGGGGGGAAAGLAGVIIILLIALFGWLWNKPGGRKFLLYAGVVILVGAGIFGLVILIQNSVQAANNQRLAATYESEQQTIRQEIDWAVANPDQAVTISRIADAPCQSYDNASNCLYPAGIYSITNHLTHCAAAVSGNQIAYTGGNVAPGETIQVENPENVRLNIDEVLPVCYMVVICPDKSYGTVLHSIDNPVCFSPRGN